MLGGHDATFSADCSLDSDDSEPLIYKQKPEVVMRPLTVRACVAGVIIGAAIAAMNVSFGLKAGWTQGGSVLAAITGIAFFTALRPRLMVAFTPEEATITQTVASAAGTMTSAAGLVSAIPALKMLNKDDKSYIELTVWALAVAYLGIFFAVPLRRRLVLKEKLRFPSGTATAVTIKSVYANSASAMSRARVMLWWFLGSGAWTLLIYFVPVLERPPLLPAIHLGVVAEFGWGILFDPLLFGGGMLSGSRVGFSVMLGGVVAWGIVAPLVRHAGWAPEDVMVGLTSAPLTPHSRASHRPLSTGRIDTEQKEPRSGTGSQETTWGATA